MRELIGKLKRIKGVVFDMDGLMFDSERIVQYSWNEAGQQMGYGLLGDENMCHTIGFNMARRQEYFYKKYGQNFPFEEFKERYRKAYAEYVDRHGVPAKEGLHELLEVLWRQKIPMAIATSSSYEHARRNVEKERIAGYFQGMVTGNMVTEGKPSPEIYRKACELLSVEPEKALALEDSLHGILSAHRAGMVTVMVPDLIKDSSSVDGILDGKAASLLEVARWIEDEENE